MGTRRTVKAKSNTVFLCNVGHISREAIQYKNYYGCNKVRTSILTRKEIVCKNKTVLVSANGLRRIHRRGWAGGIIQAADFVGAYFRA